jgi:putative ABC transport system ATP-binding protein
MARALANDPPIVAADEPTGNLDSRTADSVLKLFQDLAANGKTIVIVTHDHEIIRLVNRAITLEDGQIVHTAFNPEASTHANTLE